MALARLARAGELRDVWVPDKVHEAVRDVVRARHAAGGTAFRSPKRTSVPARARRVTRMSR